MKKRNPRYVATDETGYELAYIPAFNAADALKRAKQLYPGRKLKVTKTDEQMYIGRGAKEAEARERAARRAARAAAAPAKRVKRNGTHIHADMIDHLDVARVHNPSAYTEAYLDENAKRGQGSGITPGTFLAYNLKGKAKQYSSKYLAALLRDLKSRSDVIAGLSQGGGTAYYRIAQNPRRRRTHNPMLDHDTARDIYSRRNNAGLGFGIGEDGEDIQSATEAAGWKTIQRYDASLLLATDSSGNHFLVGGDGLGNDAWVIKVPSQAELDEPEESDRYHEAYEYEDAY